MCSEKWSTHDGVASITRGVELRHRPGRDPSLRQACDGVTYHTTCAGSYTGADDMRLQVTTSGRKLPPGGRTFNVAAPERQDSLPSELPSSSSLPRHILCFESTTRL